MAGIIERYRSRLPVTDDTPVITLNEGSTPLIPAPVSYTHLTLPTNREV